MTRDECVEKLEWFRKNHHVLSPEIKFLISEIDKRDTSLLAINKDFIVRSQNEREQLEMLDKAIDILTFYAGRSENESHRVVELHPGERARNFLEKLEVPDSWGKD